MKKTTLLFAVCTIMSLMNVRAQTDYTSLITNPSFETGNATGWTWIGATGYAWLGPNNDGDATKDGTYINGLWNASIGDAECSQTITGLTSGYYKVTALITVSTGRLTNQRLFATTGSVTKSMLYGVSSHAAYNATNLSVLGATESYSFGGYAESTSEKGPFNKLSVVNHVTDGSLTLGIRVSGKGSGNGYDFSYSSKGDAGFFKFDGFKLTEVSAVATLDNIALSSGALNTAFDPATLTYNATLPIGTTSVTPSIIPTVDGVAVSGTGTIDVSSKSGKSTIIITALDGTTQKTYTINYTVLSLSNDATLSALTTSIGTLTPTFSPTVTSYKALLPIGTSAVTPTATKNDSKATVSGTTTVTLTNGKGTSTILVTAEDGTKKTYTINYDYAYIINPSFETGDATGWTWTGATGYAWLGPNTDGDATKDGSYVNGLWNASIGDAECSQTITGLSSGNYQITALATVSTNRLSNQRLFASSGSTSVSMLYAANTESAYSSSNLAILGANETYSFGGYATPSTESGPFNQLSVVCPVSNGSLTLGIRVSGKSSANGYDFSYSSKGDVGFFKFDGFTMTYLGGTTSTISPSSHKFSFSVINRKLTVKGAESYKVYDIRGIEIKEVKINSENTYVSLLPAIYLVRTNKGETFKVLVY